VGRRFCGGCCSLLLCVESRLGPFDLRVGWGRWGAEGKGGLEFRDGGLWGAVAQVELAELEEGLGVAGLAGGRVGQSLARRGQAVQGYVCR
jgi:hypothetical protein